MLGEESAAKWPLRGIVEPGEHDVRCERRRGREHPGNVAFRQMVDAHSAAYASAAPGKERTTLAEMLVKEWRDQVPPGRFLQQNADTGLWDDIGQEKAVKKVSTRLWTALGYGGGTEAAASLPGLQSQPATTPPVELNMDVSGSSSNSGALGCENQTPRVLPLKKRDHSGSDASDLSDGPLRELNSNDLLNLSGATVRLAERLEREELELESKEASTPEGATEGDSTGEETGQSTPEGATEDGSTGEETEQSTPEEEKRAMLEAEERWKLLAAEEAAKLEAEREAARLAAEEAKRLAAEEARQEAERKMARLEAQRLAERRATEELAAQEAAREAAAAEKLEARRLEAKRLAAGEAQRLEAQQLAEKRATEELAAQEEARLEAEKRARLEVERVKSAATSRFSPMVSTKPDQSGEAPPATELEVASAIKAETKPVTGKRKAPGSRVFDLEYAEGHKRPPRASRTVRKINYQEPSLGKKLRRGDKHFPSFRGFSPKDDASKK
ncbi:hypothetical protein ACHAXT_012991 [Thalassiosira profunda]